MSMTKTEGLSFSIFPFYSTFGGNHKFAMKSIINSKKAPAPIGPYSQAVRFGDLLLMSGQIALDSETGQLVRENIEAETEKVMQNIGAVLSEAGLGFDDVLKCTIFIRNMGDFARINEVYGKYFKSNPPARETVEVSRLPKDVNVEISLIAGYASESGEKSTTPRESTNLSGTPLPGEKYSPDGPPPA